MSTMALQLPSSFVDVESEEMEYVDGGNGWWNSVPVVAGAIDILIGFVPVIGELNDLSEAGKLVRAGRTYIRTGVQVALNEAKIAVSSAMLDGITNALTVVSGVSIGTAIAVAIDHLDGKPDGYCFG